VAEEVQISNVGGDGVASEVTLQRLVTSIEAMAKKSGIDSKSQAAKLQKLYNQEVDKSSKATKDQTAETQKQTTATKDATQETNKLARSLGAAAGKGLGALFQSTVGLTKAFYNNNTSVEAFASQLPVFGKTLGFLGGIADESIDAFRGLSASGASFGGSITNMRNAAAGMQISLSEMTQLFASQAPALAALGGTVEQGAQRFAKMNKNIKATGDFDSLMRMGFAVEDINEGMGDYIALQARMGTLQGRSTAELAAGSANYLKQIDLLAKVTGKTREEAKAALDAQAADSVARTLLNQFDRNTEEGQKKFDNLTTSLALLDEVGGSTAEALKGMLTGNPTKAAGELLAVLGDAGTPVLEAMEAIGDGADPQVLLNAFRMAGGELENFAGADADSRARIIQELKDQGNPLGDFLDNATVMMDLSERDLGAAARSQAAAAEARDAATDAMLTFENQQRELSGKMHEIFIQSGVLDAIGAGLTVFGDILSGITGYLTTFSENVATGGWFSAITTVLMDGLGALWDNAGVVGALVAGIGVLFASKAAAGALTRSIGSKISGMFGGGESAGGKTGGGKTGGGLGKGIGNIGKGLGKGLGGVLKGIASGLIFFANPLVPLGAAAVGAAITAIGAGIAGATWLIGNSLPSLKDGLKGFEELNGDALISAGKGMGAVALGMGAFGAGSAVAGLGSLVGSVTSGIAGLFGGETDPLAQLEKFQEKSFDEATITANANSIVAYSKAMAALGAAEGLSGIGAAVGAVGGAIAGLFGGDDPLTKMKQFEAYTFDSAKIKSNAEAVSAYASAMKDFPTSPAPSIFGSFATGVATLFGAETDPFAPMMRFGDLTFNTAGIIANAGAVAAYATAMKDFPATPSASVFTALKDGVIGLLGGETDPFAPMMRFGNLKFNSEGIATNAGAVSAFADAMANMPTIDAERSGGVLGAIAGWFAGDEVMPWDSVKAFGDANISAEGVTANAAAINAMTSSLNGFSVEKLDTTGIVSYTSAMERLVEVLGELNDELAADNKAGLGTGTNAGDVVSKMDTIGSGGGAGSDQLNNIMNQVLLVLNEMRDLDIDVERNTRNIIGSNLAQGGVSNVAR